MVFSYLEPVLHKARLVLGGGRYFSIFFFLLISEGCGNVWHPALSSGVSPTRGCTRQASSTSQVAAFGDPKGEQLRGGWAVSTRGLPKSSRAFP